MHLSRLPPPGFPPAAPIERITQSGGIAVNIGAKPRPFKGKAGFSGQIGKKVI
jgi:hypothetical protein